MPLKLTGLGIAEGEKHDQSSYLHRLYKASSWFTGTTAEEFVQHCHGAAMRLARHSELIVARKPYFDGLPVVSLEEIAQCDGSQDGGSYNEGWIATGGYSDGVVYSVTST